MEDWVAFILILVSALIGLILGGWASWQDAKRYFSLHPEELQNKKEIKIIGGN